LTLTLFLLAFCFLLCIQLASCFIWECLLLLLEIFSLFIMISILYEYLFFYSLYSILHYQLFDYYHSCLIGLHWKCSIGCRTIFGELFVRSAFILMQLVWLVDHAMILWRLEMHLEIWLVIELRMYIIFGLFRELDASLNKGWCLDLSSTRGLQNWSEVKLYLLLILECALLINLVLIYLKVNWSICLVHFLTFKRLIFLTSE